MIMCRIKTLKRFNFAHKLYNMNRLAAIWVNVDFARGNDFMSFDEDYTSSGSGNYPTLEEIFINCEYGEKYYQQASNICREIGLRAEDIKHVWLYFNDPETNSRDPYFLDEEDCATEGVNVIVPGKAAYIGHFPI